MKYTLLILFAVSITCCTNKSKIPSDVIGKEEMAKVLWDMMIADRYAAQFLVKDSAKKNITEETFRLYGEVFAINNITRKDFVRSYKFYMTRPDISKVLFDTILQRANRQKEALYLPKEQTLDTTLRKADTTKKSVAP